MRRFTPARTYLTAAAIALGLAVVCGYLGVRMWWGAWVPAVVLTAIGAASTWMGTRPAIEVADGHLKIGRRFIEWKDIRRVDQTGWVSPLVADLTLSDQTQLRLVYPGETTESNELLKMIQQRSEKALINGVPYRKIFGEPAGPVRQAQEPVRYRLMSEADEADVERMYHQLRSAGRLDEEE